MRGIWSRWLWNSYDKRDEFGVKGTFSSYSINEIDPNLNSIDKIKNDLPTFISEDINQGLFKIKEKQLI